MIRFPSPVRVRRSPRDALARCAGEGSSATEIIE